MIMHQSSSQHSNMHNLMRRANKVKLAREYGLGNLYFGIRKLALALNSI